MSGSGHEHTLDAVPGWLADRGLLSPDDVLTRGVLCVEASSRNLNARVLVGEDAGIFVKRARDSDTRRTLGVEAAVLRHLGGAASDGDRWFPELIDWDAGAGTLALALVRASENGFASAYRARGTAGTRPPELLGTALARLHALPSTSAAPTGTPWCLRLHGPDETVFQHASAANLRLIEIVQDTPALCRALDEMAATWRPDALIHFDVKWENVLIQPDEDRLVLVDWELAGVGDPAYDVGCVLAELLTDWLFGLPTFAGDPPPGIDALAARRLRRIRPAARAFWRAYGSAAGEASASLPRLLLRAARYAAARLLQRAWERHQRSSESTGHGVSSLQVASNVVSHPHAALDSLLGLAVS